MADLAIGSDDGIWMTGVVVRSGRLVLTLPYLFACPTLHHSATRAAVSLAS